MPLGSTTINTSILPIKNRACKELLVTSENHSGSRNFQNDKFATKYWRLNKITRGDPT